MEFLKKIKYYLAGNLSRIISAPFFQYEIDPKDACTIFGSRFNNGWNHIVETLREYDDNPHINYKETSLYAFLKFFKIKSISDFTDDIVVDKIKIFNFPWGSSHKKLNLDNKSVLNSRFCGPSTDDFIKKEFFDILNLYNKLKIDGYKPYKYPNSFIIGTWLTNEENNSVFMVFGGNHRMAILSHLGFKKIQVRTHKMLIRKVNEKKINFWPSVKKNKYSKKHAKKIFDIFFEENGEHIKKIIYKNHTNE